MVMRLLIIIIALWASTAQANQCLDNISAYAKQDSMIKAWGIEKGTEDTIVFVDNVRNLKTIDITFYGFDADMAHAMQDAMGCTHVRFEDAYTSMGLPRFTH